MFGQFAILIVLIALNAFFAASEVALISVKPGVVRKLGKSGGRRGRCLAELTQDSGKFLATVQIGVTLAGFLASAFAADSFSDPLTDYLESLGFHYLSHGALDSVVVILITVLLSYVSLVFGELIPKQLGLRFAETLALNVALPIYALSKLAAPFVWILDLSVNTCMKVFGNAGTDEQTAGEEEIRMLADIGEEKGLIEPEEKQMIDNVFELSDRDAGELMTHRKDIVGLDLAGTPEMIEETILSSGHSCFPVYSGNIDNIVGVVLFREYVMKNYRDRRRVSRTEGEGACGDGDDGRKAFLPSSLSSSSFSSPPPAALDGVLQSAYLVPKNTKAGALLQDMRRKKIPMAVLLDEFGGTSGIVTVSDLLSELAASPGNSPDEEFEVLQENVWRVDGKTRISILNRLFSLQIPDEGSYDTLGGFLFDHFHKIPEEGAEFSLPEAGIVFIVEETGDRRIRKVVIRKQDQAFMEEPAEK